MTRHLGVAVALVEDLNLASVPMWQFKPPLSQVLGASVPSSDLYQHLSQVW